MDKFENPFTIDNAMTLYNVDRWGGGYFTINAQGHAAVRPGGQEQAEIDVMELIEEAKNQNLALPLVIRFQDLLRDRVKTINLAFSKAIAEQGYQNHYRGVFPLKVNQLREVVEEILDAGKEYHFGIEAGSKPELIAALAMHTDAESLIIVNGYKDSQVIQTALLGRKLGKSVILVVEKLEELNQILTLSKALGVEPLIGLRVRLLSKGAGKWATSGGEHAKFGLSTADLVTASQVLHEQNLAHVLRLVHFHVGSQVPDIETLNRATREAARFYAKLYKMGHTLGYLDIGGGLGVDYDGSRTTFDSSTNYSLNEYARDTVYNIMDICDAETVPHPIIVSESGRALVAYHSILIVEAFGSIEKNKNHPPILPQAEDPKVVHELAETWENVRQLPTHRLENLHDAQSIRERAQAMFDLGLLDLPAKAKIDTLYWDIAASIVDAFRGMPYVPEEVKEIETALGDQFLCNFSVFQSLLDHWALGQLFPVMPLHRLTERPNRNGTLVDITCDSDGKMNQFIDLQDIKDTLPLHRHESGKPYYLGFFLVGAYQDIMGDMHNLFGKVNEMHVFLDEDEEAGYYVEEVLPGSTVGEVLSLLQWDTKELARRMKSQTDAAIRHDQLKPKEAMRLLDAYEQVLNQYTYLEGITQH